MLNRAHIFSTLLLCLLAAGCSGPVEKVCTVSQNSAGMTDGRDKRPVIETKTMAITYNEKEQWASFNNVSYRGEHVKFRDGKIVGSIFDEYKNDSGGGYLHNKLAYDIKNGIVDASRSEMVTVKASHVLEETVVTFNGTCK